MKQPLTASRIKTLLHCLRRHYWRYEVGLAAATAGDALRFGSAWHRAMEARWHGDAYEFALAAAVGTRQEIDELQAAILAGLLAAYYGLYAEDPVRELHPEIEFTGLVRYSRDFCSAGKIDGLGTLRDGRVALVEHKTTGESVAPDSDYWLRLRADKQIAQYVLAARELGWDIETVIYDVVRKPAIRQKQNETVPQFADRLAADAKARPEFYFARREVPVIEQDLAEFEAERRQIGRLIAALRREQLRCAKPEHAWPRNLGTMTCAGCEFASFCLQNLSVNPAQPPAGFTVGPAHPELAPETGGE
jgi:hypothetical protein